VKILGKSKSYREECGEFLCDGLKLLEEAVKSGEEIKNVLLAENIDFKLPSDVLVFTVKDDILNSLSPLKSHQGVLFTCRMKKPERSDFTKGTHILLDRIQDPGNVGTIMRCAHAFGIDSVILTDGSADIYNPKTIRASMGAIFKQRVIRLNNNEILELKKIGVKFFGASNNTNAVELINVCLRDKIIILGNEGQGISVELEELCEQMIKIPVSSECESLNVASAASILMWEASKVCQL